MSNYYPTWMPYEIDSCPGKLDIIYLTKHLHYNETKMTIMFRKMEFTSNDIHKLRQQVEHDVTANTLNYNFDSLIDLYYGEEK